MSINKIDRNHVYSYNTLYSVATILLLVDKNTTWHYVRVRSKAGDVLKLNY